MKWNDEEEYLVFEFAWSSWEVSFLLGWLMLLLLLLLLNIMNGGVIGVGRSRIRTGGMQVVL